MSYDYRTNHTQNVYIMANHSVQYDRGFIEAIVSLATFLQERSFLDKKEKSAFGQPKEYTDGYISGLNLLSSFLDKHRMVPRLVYDKIQFEINLRQDILGHTPKFKVNGKETPQEELSKTTITPQSVDASKGYEVYGAFADGHPSMVDGPLLPKLAPGTDGSRSNKPVFDEATGGHKPDVVLDDYHQHKSSKNANIVLGLTIAKKIYGDSDDFLSDILETIRYYQELDSEDEEVDTIHTAQTIQKASGENPSKGLNIIKNYTTREDVTPVHIIPNGLNAIHPGENIQMEPEEKPSEALNRAAASSAIEALAKTARVPVDLVKRPSDIATHNISVTPDHYSPLKTRTLNYILTSGNFGDYHVGDQVIINEVVEPHDRKTGYHLHVLIKEVHFMGDKVLLLFDMSGDF